MIESIFYAILAILGLGFLVFIHELGHYLLARRTGMRVEVFAIGFGKPIYSWMHKGVKWQIGILPFGGYVKIVGMQKEGSLEPHEIADGFYGKTPWQRIQVALAGPLVNIVFALAIFAVLWMSGGREKPFAEFTHRIGWVDPQSALYEKGVRPGDVVETYDGRPFRGFKDLFTASLMQGDTNQIQGYKVDYTTGEKQPFNYTLKTYEDPRSGKDKLSTVGVASPAQYLIYDKDLNYNLLSPMSQSGIEPKDRLVWVDGESVFSFKQLSQLINESTAFLTVKRDGTLFQTKVPRVRIDDLNLNTIEKAEVGDWQHELGLKGRLQDLYFIPYNLSPQGFVEGKLSFIDEQDQQKALQAERSAHFQSLQEGDQILAIDGQPISGAYDLLEQLQSRKVLVIAERASKQVDPVLWTEADKQFNDFAPSDLSAIISSIGTTDPVTSSGNLRLLSPVVPKSYIELPWTAEQNVQLVQEYETAKKQIEKIQDPQKRTELLQELETSRHRMVLGVGLKDRVVLYNPTPLEQFSNILEDTWRTLSGLFSGALKPKYISGPVGIVHVVHNSWLVGGKEALFWMAVISLNLGLVNLLPIPVLDGGHIFFALLQMITKRPVRSKTMERLIIPFIAVMIGLFIYITYQDISRLFSKFF